MLLYPKKICGTLLNDKTSRWILISLAQFQYSSYEGNFTSVPGMKLAYVK